MTRTMPLTISASAAAYLLKADDDWQLVVNWTMGDLRRVLEPTERRELRLLADGFGDLRGCDAPYLEDMLNDWSHVRDSSTEAVARMASWIRQFVADHTDKPACELCGGSGQVRHKSGLVTFACPKC